MNLKPEINLKIHAGGDDKLRIQFAMHKLYAMQHCDIYFYLGSESVHVFITGCIEVVHYLLHGQVTQQRGLLVSCKAVVRIDYLKHCSTIFLRYF